MNMKSFAKNVAVISQNYKFEDNITVYEFVSLARTPYVGVVPSLSAKDKQLIDDALTKMHIKHLSDKFIANLSGGQHQKVLIAMAMAQDTDIIILDEPTTYLDVKSQYELLTILKQMHLQNKTIIAILHDINQAIEFSDQLVLMKHGQIYSTGAPNVVINEQAILDVFDFQAQIVHNSQNNKYIL